MKSRSDTTFRSRLSWAGRKRCIRNTERRSRTSTCSRRPASKAAGLLPLLPLLRQGAEGRRHHSSALTSGVALVRGRRHRVRYWQGIALNVAVLGILVALVTAGVLYQAVGGR